MNNTGQDEGLRDSLVSKVEAALRRQEGKVRKLLQALEECGREERYSRYGELLKANLSRLSRGQKTATVVDYFSPGGPEIEIELALDKTPLENMQACFKRARKLRNGRPRVERELKAAREQAGCLKALLDRVREVQQPHALAELQAQAEPLLSHRKPKKPAKQPQARLGPRRFVSSDGFEILVGRNQRQNDALSLSVARGCDLFLHASGSPGSHVIIRTGGRQVPRKTMLEAANLAVYYSKSPTRRFAQVSWTRVKNVSKPRGAKPGLVYLSAHRTLDIKPDSALVKILHDNATGNSGGVKR